MQTKCGDVLASKCKDVFRKQGIIDSPNDGFLPQSRFVGDGKTMVLQV